MEQSNSFTRKPNVLDINREIKQYMKDSFGVRNIFLDWFKKDYIDALKIAIEEDIRINLKSCSNAVNILQEIYKKTGVNHELNNYYCGITLDFKRMVLFDSATKVPNPSVFGIIGNVADDKEAKLLIEKYVTRTDLNGKLDKIKPTLVLKTVEGINLSYYQQFNAFCVNDIKVCKNLYDLLKDYPVNPVSLLSVMLDKLSRNPVYSKCRIKCLNHMSLKDYRKVIDNMKSNKDFFNKSIIYLEYIRTKVPLTILSLQIQNILKHTITGIYNPSNEIKTINELLYEYGLEDVLYNNILSEESISNYMIDVICELNINGVVSKEKCILLLDNYI